MDRICTYATAVLFSLLWTTASVSQSQGDWRWGHPGWDWGWGHMMFGGVMMIIFWGGIILLLVLLFRWFGTGRSSNAFGESGRLTPLDLLKERYAKGEIDKNEYEERKKVLSE